MNNISLTFPQIREKLGNQKAISNPFKPTIKKAIPKMDFIGTGEDAQIHNAFNEEAKKSVYEGLKTQQLQKFQLRLPRKRLTKLNRGGYKPFQVAVYDECGCDKLKGGAVPYDYARRILLSRANQLKNIQNVKNGLPSDFQEQSQEITNYDLPNNQHEAEQNAIKFNLTNILASLQSGDVDKGYLVSQLTEIWKLLVRNLVYFDRGDLVFLEEIYKIFRDLVKSDGLLEKIINTTVVISEEDDEETQRIKRDMLGDEFKRDKALKNFFNRADVIERLLRRYLDRRIYDLQFPQRKTAIKSLFKEVGMLDLSQYFDKLVRKVNREYEGQEPTPNTGEGDGGGGETTDNPPMGPDFPNTGGPNPPPGGPPVGDLEALDVYGDEEHPQAFDPNFPPWETLEDLDFRRLPFGEPMGSQLWRPGERLPIGDEAIDNDDLLNRVYAMWADSGLAEQELEQVDRELREREEEGFLTEQQRIRQEEMEALRGPIIEEERRRRRNEREIPETTQKRQPQTAAEVALTLREEEQEEEQEEEKEEEQEQGIPDEKNLKVLVIEETFKIIKDLKGKPKPTQNQLQKMAIQRVAKNRFGINYKPRELREETSLDDRIRNFRVRLLRK